MSTQVSTGGNTAGSAPSAASSRSSAGSDRLGRRWRWALWAAALLTPLGVLTQSFLWPGRTQWPVVSRQLDAPVILITVPGLRADRLHHLGYKKAITPNLDRLARHGVSFTGAYAVSNDARASAASLLTGACPNVTGVHGPGDVLPGSARTMAEVLKNRGYHCVALVGDPDLFAAGLDQGFDEFLTAAPGEGAAHLLERGFSLLRSAPTANVFLWIDLPDLHRPYGGAQLDLRPFAAEAPAHFGVGLEYTVALDTSRPGQPGWGPREWEWMSDRYDAAVHQVDADLGHFIDLLAADFRLETLTLCVTATRGERLAERAGPSFTHGVDLYEPSVHVPLLLRLPSRHVRSLRLERLASSEDVAPTLLELGARVKNPERALVGSTGFSLEKDITRLDETRPRVAIEGRHGQHGARAHALVVRAGTGLYKLIRSQTADDDTETGVDFQPRDELYLLNLDPEELKDVAVSHALHSETLGDWLQAWIQDCALP